MGSYVCAQHGVVEDPDEHIACTLHGVATEAPGGNRYHPAAEYAAGWSACRAEVVRRLVRAWGPPSPTSNRALDAGFAELIREIEDLDVDAAAVTR